MWANNESLRLSKFWIETCTASMSANLDISIVFGVRQLLIGYPPIHHQNLSNTSIYKYQMISCLKRNHLVPKASSRYPTSTKSGSCINTIPIRRRVTKALTHSNRLVPLTQQALQHMLYQHLTCLVVDVVADHKKVVGGRWGVGKGGVENVLRV